MNIKPIFSRLVSKLAIIGVAAALPAAASAGGLLRHHWASASFDFTAYESAAYDDGTGFSLDYNRPIELPIAALTDIGLSLRSWERDGARLDVPDLDGKQILLNATFIGPSDETTPYLRLGLGWAETKAGGVKRNAFMHAIGIGAELPNMGALTLSGYVDWTDSFDGDVDGTLTYGCVAVCAVAVPRGGIDVFARVQGDDHFNVTGSLGVLVRF